MQNIVLITQVGISMVVPPLLGLYLGSLLDKWLGTKYLFAIILMVCGVAAAFMNTYKLIMAAMKEKKKGNDSDRQWQVRNVCH